MTKLGHLKGDWGFKTKKRKAIINPAPPRAKELSAPCALAMWVNTHCKAGPEFRAQLARWKLTNSQFRDFINGHWDIPALKLYNISKDTGISMETLCQEWHTIALSRKQPLLKENK